MRVPCPHCDAVFDPDDAELVTSEFDGNDIAEWDVICPECGETVSLG